MGMTLAKNLEVNVGSTITMISQGFDGSIAAERLTIVGLFKSGNPEYDQGLLLMPLDQAKETFSMMGYIHSIVVRLKSSSDMDNIKEYIKKYVNINPLKFWGLELMSEMVQFIVMDDAMHIYLTSFFL
jgi:ABC-type lipoprotein release transport system permease subunit